MITEDVYYTITHYKTAHGARPPGYCIWCGIPGCEVFTDATPVDTIEIVDHEVRLTLPEDK